MRLPVAAALGAILLVLTSCAPSQASIDGCEQAIEVVRGGESGAQEERAWSALPGCGAAGGVAAAGAWTSLRQVSDSARIARTYEHLRRFRDSSLSMAARTVLLDSTATSEARVSSAMLIVAQLVEHADPEYRVFSTTGPHDACAVGSATGRSMLDGAPLPTNASALAESTALRVLADASAPQTVRNAARCLYGAVARDDGVLTQSAPSPDVTGHVSLSSGRLDATRARLAGDVRPRARRRSRPSMRPPADSMRGVVRWNGGGGCATSQPFLETRAGKRVRLDGSRDVLSQVPGREVVVFGRETTSPPHPLSRPSPLFTVDSFVVRAHAGTRVHDGILRRGPRGDVLETHDGQRLPVANLPRALDKADGRRVWIGEPLGTPTSAGVIDPAYRHECAE